MLDKIISDKALNIFGKRIKKGLLGIGSGLTMRSKIRLFRWDKRYKSN